MVRNILIKKGRGYRREREVCRSYIHARFQIPISGLTIEMGSSRCRQISSISEREMKHACVK